MKTVGIEEGLRMMKGIASLIATNLNLDSEDASVVILKSYDYRVRGFPV